MTNRILTLVLGAVQGYGIIVTMYNSGAITFTETLDTWMYIKTIIIMMAGSMLVMWMADQITQKGIGNGVSMLIFAGIVSSLPSQIFSAVQYFVSSELMTEEVRIPIHQKRVSKKCEPQGTPWWSRGEDSLSLPRAQAQPLAGERRSCKQSGMISHPPFQN